MRKSNIAIPILVLSLLAAGCTQTGKNDAGSSAQNNSEASDSNAQTADNSDSSTKEETQDTDSSDAPATSRESDASTEDTKDNSDDTSAGNSSDAPSEAPTPVLPSSEKLAALIEGKESLSFQYYYENVFKADEYLSYVDETLERIPANTDYTLQELLDTLYEIIHTEEYYYHFDENSDISTISYANIDCGADGIPELALYIPGPFVDSEGGLTLIVKELEGKLQVVYGFVDWSRSSTSINEYGYITSGGSNGASNHGYDVSIIDKDGVYTFGFYEEEESDITQFASQNYYNKEFDYSVFDSIKYDGIIVINTLRIGEYSEKGNPTYYTYQVFDPLTYEVMDVPDLYTNSEFKDIMDKFTETDFITYEEFEAKENERKTEIGATEKIRTGNQPEYYPTVFVANKTASLDASSDEQEPASITTLKPDSIQFELNLIEAQSDEYDGLDYAAMPQQSINTAIYECYTLWDDELNSLWARLMEELSPEEKDKLIKEQRDWIKAKEGAMTDAQIEAGGGTLAPQLQYGEGKVQTRKRAYFLASLLAQKRGESFEAPDDAQ